MRAWKDGLPLLYFSFCRERKGYFFFFNRAGDSKEAFLGYCFQESVGSVLEANVGHTHLGATHRQCLPWACPHPIQPPALRPSLSRLRRPPSQPQSPGGLTLPPSLFGPLLSSLLSPCPPSFGVPSLLRALPPALAPSFLRTLPPSVRPPSSTAFAAVGFPTVCASVSGPFPAPRPSPGPRLPFRRTCPLPGRPRSRDRDRAERSHCASAAPPVGAPNGSELRADLPRPAPPRSTREGDYHF